MAASALNTRDAELTQNHFFVVILLN